MPHGSLTGWGHPTRERRLDDEKESVCREMVISGLEQQGVTSEGEERWVWTRHEADSEMYKPH